jgi:hypothetical protein
MKSFKELKINTPFIAVLGSGTSILDLTPSVIQKIKTKAFMITLNYAPIRIQGHLNFWSDPKVSFFLTKFYEGEIPQPLLACRKGCVNPPLSEKIDHFFCPLEENLSGTFSAVWLLQLLQKYFPEKIILLLGFDFYLATPEVSKWYDLYINFDKKSRKSGDSSLKKLNLCMFQMRNFVSSSNIFNCNPESKLPFFQKGNWQSILYKDETLIP